MTRYQLARWAPVVAAVLLALFAIADLYSGHYLRAAVSAVLAVALAAGIPALRRAARTHELRDGSR